MREELVIVYATEKPDAVGDAEIRRQPFERDTLRTVARDHSVDATSRGLGQCAHDEINALERRQPGNDQHVVAVCLAPVRPMRRRRPEYAGSKAEVVDQSLLNRP